MENPSVSRNTQTTHKDHQVSEQKFPLVLLAMDLQSPENLGSLLRVADALGVEAVWLTGECPAVSNPRVARTARATQKHVTVIHEKNALVAIQQLREQNYTIVCLELTDNSVALADWSLRSNEKICLVLGAERYGIEQTILDSADVCVQIPMHGHNSSMNVVVAAAIATYDITQKMQAINLLGC